MAVQRLDESPTRNWQNSMDSLPASIWFGGIRDQMIHEDDVWRHLC